MTQLLGLLATLILAAWAAWGVYAMHTYRGSWRPGHMPFWLLFTGALFCAPVLAHRLGLL